MWSEQCTALTDVAEYDVKIALVHKLAVVTDWPASAASGPFRLCVLGNARFGGALDVLRGETVNGRALVLDQQPGFDELRNCNLLYVTASDKAALSRIAGQLAGLPVLLIGESEGALDAGAAINLTRKKNRIVLEVDLAALARAHLTVSSKLLRFAEVR